MVLPQGDRGVELNGAGMTLASFKRGVFLLELLNSLATAFYFNYLFFYLKYQFGLTNQQNLLVCALNGFVFMLTAYPGGRFGQKRGYMGALILGFATMAIALCISLVWRSLTGAVVMMVVWTVGMCFTWPNLEALTAERETRRRIPRLVGIYNCVWAAGFAFAYFVGGAVVGVPPDWTRMFWIPAGINLLQIVVALVMVPSWKLLRTLPDAREAEPEHKVHPEAAHFLKMAWLANPFAYIAINAAIPLIPDLAQRFQLSPRQAGFFCSIWFFARLLTFMVLAAWPGWHYHFGCLVSSYVGVIICFAAMLLLDHLWLILVVQVVLGWCLGVIYYSSLYYSMDAGDTKGEHAGVHEAAIGVGIFVGPAIGAASIWAFPAHPESGVWGVALVLVIGLGGLVYLRRANGRKTAVPGSPAM